MTLSAFAGPLVVYGQQSPLNSGVAPQPDYNGDAAPSVFYGGIMTMDTRYPYRAGMAAGALSAFGFCQGALHLLVDQAPSVLSNTNVAAAQAVTNGVPMTLAGATNASLTISTTALQVQPSGNVMPIGTRFLDGPPAMILYGPNGNIGTIDPRTMLSRCVSITAAAGAATGNLLVRGFDVYGYPLTEQITAVAASTVNGNKGFKAVASVTPQFTSGFNYSVGTADVFEVPLAMYVFAALGLYWKNNLITSPTGFTSAILTPSTATTGSVRGTYAVQSPSDGTSHIQLAGGIPPWSPATAIGTGGAFGSAQYAG